MNRERDMLLTDFQKKICYFFKNKKLLNQSLTHSSFANENRYKKKLTHNERLEFLGDSVLNIIVSEYVYKKFPDDSEGQLTKIRASIVCESSLAYVARKMDLGDYLLLGKGEESTGGRNRDSILADAFEALLGAIYLDGGLESSRKFIIDILKREISQAKNFGYIFTDYKTKFQEVLQKNKKSKVEYLVTREEGPDHDKIFYVNLMVDGKLCGQGEGRSKKEAEQKAAKSALKKIGDCDE